MKNNDKQNYGRAYRQAEILMDFIQQAENAVKNMAPVDKMLNENFRKNRKFGSKDRRLYSDGVFAWFRWYGWTKAIRTSDPATALALSWLLSYEKIPDAIRFLLENSECDTSQWHSLSEQPLKKRAACFCSWTQMTSEPLLRDLAPPWLASCLSIPQDSTENTITDQFIESFMTRPPTWISIPPSSQDTLAARLQKAGVESHIHPYLRTAFYLNKPFALSELHKNAGKGILIQDLASQCVCAICDPQPGETWWDTCAGAGGKSIYLAQLMKNNGQVFSTDIRSKILRQIHRRAGEAQVSILKIKQMDLRESPRFDFTCDGVLVDAPCSGLGTWGRNPDMRWRTSHNQIAGKARVQRQILEKASQAVRAGGKLIYAVCTNTDAETIGIIQPFLFAHPEFKLEPVKHPLDGRTTDGQVWIWPWDGPCNGMYIARLKRED